MKAFTVGEADLTNLLREWRYEPGRVIARRFVGPDGRAKLQVRIHLGLLQMELDGRPDGEQPAGFESLLACHQDRLRRYAEANGRTEGFVLSGDDCRELREEAVQYYHRYVGLMAIGDYPAVVRDTTRNLTVFDLCRDYAAAEADRTLLEQFRPHVLMMRARAQAEEALAAGRPRQALAAIDAGLAEIRHELECQGDDAAAEHAGEIQLLRGMREALVPKLPVSQRMELQERLRAAVDAENYELAAVLRDELRMMEE